LFRQNGFNFFLYTAIYFFIFQITYQPHPSKRIKSVELSTTSNQFAVTQSIPSSINSPSSSLSDDDYTAKVNNERCSTDLAVLIRQKANLSLSQTIKVLQTLHSELKDERLQPPSRSGLDKACNAIENSISIEPNNHVLQFDGKTYTKTFGKSKFSVIAICFANKLIGLKEVADKKASTIFQTLSSVLNCNNLQPNIVVADTEPTNTGLKNGVVVQLQAEYDNVRFEPCRIHVLDLVLKHQFSAYFPEKTTSSEMPYSFVNEIYNSWKSYKDSYILKCSDDKADEVAFLPLDETRRKDYLLLLKLTKAVIHQRKTQTCPLIKNFPNQPPSISNARWNSRAIFSLFAELLDFSDQRIFFVNTFIIEVCFCLFFI